MTKLRINRGIFIVAMMVFALAGCKKVDDTSAFTLTSAKDLHFNYGQEKIITFSIRNIHKINKPSVPQGWSYRTEGPKIIITAPVESDNTASLKGEIDVKATTNSSSEISRVISVAVKIATEITAPANCHIVSEPNKRYKFDAKRKGNESIATLSPNNAILVWSTVKSGISHVSLEDGYIYFATDDETTLVEANALIAAVDKNNKAVWSWHIWATEFDPAVKPDLLGGEEVMNRNLGAFASSDDSDTEAFKSYGLYYQWGRKDPFVGPKTWDSSTLLSIYDSANKWMTLTYEESTANIGTTAYATANPTHFITGTKKTAYDWLFAGRDNALWGNANSSMGTTSSKGTKSLYDPCPNGWMVAPPYIWASFTSSGEASSDPTTFTVDGEYNYGWTFVNNTTIPGAPLIYYPAAGRHIFIKRKYNFTNVVNDGLGEKGYPVGFYWSNSNSSANEGALLAFRNDYVNPGTAYHSAADTGSAEGARAGGFPVRCVAE